MDPLQQSLPPWLKPLVTPLQVMLCLRQSESELQPLSAHHFAAWSLNFEDCLYCWWNSLLMFFVFFMIHRVTVRWHSLIVVWHNLQWIWIFWTITGLLQPKKCLFPIATVFPPFVITASTLRITYQWIEFVCDVQYKGKATCLNTCNNGNWIQRILGRYRFPCKVWENTPISTV